jgi:hypothetical protein
MKVRSGRYNVRIISCPRHCHYRIEHKFHHAKDDTPKEYGEQYISSFDEEPCIMVSRYWIIISLLV